jgi:hypothetical protein
MKEKPMKKEPGTTKEPKDQLTGSCLCGAVSFSIVGDPVAQLLCFCSDCRRISGA